MLRHARGGVPECSVTSRLQGLQSSSPRKRAMFQGAVQTHANPIQADAHNRRRGLPRFCAAARMAWRPGLVAGARGGMQHLCIRQHRTYWRKALGSIRGADPAVPHDEPAPEVGSPVTAGPLRCSRHGLRILSAPHHQCLRPSREPGQPPIGTIRVVAALRRFLREGTPWRSSVAIKDQASGSAGWAVLSLPPTVHAQLVGMPRGHADLILDACSVRQARRRPHWPEPDGPPGARHQVPRRGGRRRHAGGLHRQCGQRQ